MGHSKKQITVLVDTNIILDVILKRKPFYDDSLKILELCKSQKIIGFVTEHSIATICYIIKREFDSTTCRTLLMALISFFEMANIRKEQVIEAIENNNFSDFEDCLQEECALNVSADYIITRNTKDFESSKIQALSAKEFFNIINEKHHQKI